MLSATSSLILILPYAILKGRFSVKSRLNRDTKSVKRDARGNVISTKTAGGDLMISIEWIDAPASTGNSVIGRTQELEVGDFLTDYKIVQASRVASRESSSSSSSSLA